MLYDWMKFFFDVETFRANERTNFFSSNFFECTKIEWALIFVYSNNRIGVVRIWFCDRNLTLIRYLNKTIWFSNHFIQITLSVFEFERIFEITKISNIRLLECFFFLLEHIRSSTTAMGLCYVILSQSFNPSSCDSGFLPFNWTFIQ